MENIIHDPFNDSYKSKGAPFYISDIFTQTELFDSKGFLGLRLREATATLSNVFLEFFFLWKKKWSLFLAISNFLKKIWYSISLLLMKLSRLNENGPVVVTLTLI